jgi:hypothetical protein
MESICKLCGKSGDLMVSHIVPKFIFKYLKETSPTKKLRMSTEINKRIQDGFKKYWFCRNCEVMLSYYEKYFSENIFHQIQKNILPIKYDINLIKFCVSISWRISVFIEEEGYISHFPNEILKNLKQAQDVWKGFLLGKFENPGIFEQHLYNFTGEIEGSHLTLSNNLHRYLQRTIAVNVLHLGTKIILVYSKFPGILLIGYVKLGSHSSFSSTKIHLKKGLLTHRKTIVPTELWNFINNKADDAENIKSSLSDNQNKKIMSDYNKIDIETVTASGTFQALEKDLTLKSKINKTNDE